MTSSWKKGFEIELMAPPGHSREDLARIVAGKKKGSVQRFFHPQAEPSKRERGCEIVTAPLTDDAEEVLAFLLGEAEAAGFSIPAEAALHIHFDGARLKNAGVISNLVRVLARHGAALKKLVRTNPNCV